MPARQLLLERDGPVATLRLNQPARRNAISAAMWRRLPGLIAGVADDHEICLLIVRGGDRHAFSAGADISEFPEVYANADAAARYNEQVREAQAALAGLAKPTLAAIQGVCVGGGCGIALCCDIRFAERGARFGITPARLGIAYGVEDSKRLVDAVGPSHAKDMLFSGRLIDADKALRIGLINELLEPAAFEQAVADYAAQLVANSQYSIRTAKAVVSAVVSTARPPDQALRQRLRDAFAGEDFQEGYRAFNERRKPRFRWR